MIRTTSRLRVYLRLGRVSNLPTVWSNVLAGAALAGVIPGPGRLALLGLAMTLFYVGGMFLNDAFDRAIDARERPERPIPAGLVSAREVFAIGFGLLGAGLGLTAIAKQENLRSARGLGALGFLSVPFIYALGGLAAGGVGALAYAALAGCVYHAVGLLRGEGRGRIPAAVVTLIAGISLLDAALIAGSGAASAEGAAAAAIAAFPLTLGLQRYVRGT